MAYYAAFNSVLQSLKEISNRDQYPKFLLDKLQIASIYEKLSHLKALLEDYSPKEEEAAECLETRIRDAVYKVQYILESQDILECKLSHLIPQKDKTHGVENVLHRLSIAKWKKAMPRQLQDIKEVKEEVDYIVEEVTALKIKKSNTNEDLKVINYYSTLSKQEPTSCGDTIVGFEEQITTIKDQLCGESSKLEVVSLVGMGGIGKTTLARSIFSDELIVYHFYRRAWVTVSQNYHMQKILLDILYSMHTPLENLGDIEEESLKRAIYQRLKGMRYLIIVDDLWDTKIWDDMKRIFPDDNNGSRIILTTRLLDVAVYINKSRCGSVHQMQLFDKKLSWNLLRLKVCAQETCPLELEVVGRWIAKNCRGLPLAIVVAAGLLSKVSKAREDWEDIARNLSSFATEDNEHFPKIFSLSYNNLPCHLKPCFLYMGGFPEDYQIPVSKLIKLWAAEGFLKPDEFKRLEETGEEYLKDLVKRNLVIINKKNSNGDFKYCSVHDILRDLCLKRARDESFLHIVDDDDYYLYKAGTRNIIRRLYIHHAHSRFMEAEEFSSHVGLILCFHNIRRLSSFASGFKLLRILDTLHVMFSSFPVEVLELSHLRYLALALGQGNEYFIIPLLITKLENLQTLIILPSIGYPIGSDVRVPFTIWRMPHLRHIILTRFSSFIPFGCILPNLQTLSRVVNFRFTNQVIQMIPNLVKLKAEYSIKHSEVWGNFCLYNLVQLCQLEKLDLFFSAFLIEKHISFSRENLAFPRKLKKLHLSGCRIPWEDMTVVGSLPHLQVLKLRGDAFVGDEWEPIEGEFPQLKLLHMMGLDLKYWRARNTHFPHLEHLQIYGCEKLEEIPSEIGYIPTLQLIKVVESEFAGDSALQIREEQQDLGNDVLQVHVRQPFRSTDDIGRRSSCLGQSKTKTKLKPKVQLRQLRRLLGSLDCTL